MKEEKVYVVYSYWRDRVNEPDIIGAYKDENKARKTRLKTVEEYVGYGYEEDEEFNVWIECVDVE